MKNMIQKILNKKPEEINLAEILVFQGGLDEALDFVMKAMFIYNRLDKKDM